MKKNLLLTILFTVTCMVKAQNVGIGTTTPLAKLDVNGTINSGKASATNGALQFSNSTNSNTATITTGATTASYTITLPTGIGSGGQALVVSSISGSIATLSWATPLTSSTGVTSFNTSLSGLTPGTASTGAVTLAGTLGVASGGTGATTLTGMLKGNGTGAVTAVNGTQWGAAYWSDVNTVASTAAGTSGQVLTSQGAAAPVWQGPGKISNIVVYSSGSGTYTPSSGTTAILVKLVGGGGAGSGANYSCTGNVFAGGGGGAGGYCESLITSPAASYSYAVGSGGASNTTCGASGGSGTSSTFGGLTAGGGAGGANGASSGGGVLPAGGTGGTASGGQINITGATGGYGLASYNNYYAMSGAGAGSVFGSGGGAMTWNAYSTTIAISGQNGIAKGSGGGGALANGASSASGGSGAGGIIIIYEYK